MLAGTREGLDGNQIFKVEPPLLGGTGVVLDEFLPGTLDSFVIRSSLLTAGIAWSPETTVDALSTVTNVTQSQ